MRFLDEREPQLLAYSVHLSDDGREMTVIHVHADAASLERHLEVGGEAFRAFADLLTLSDIHVYGEASPRAVEQLREKARSLGGTRVVVQAAHAGFSRLPH